MLAMSRLALDGAFGVAALAGAAAATPVARSVALRMGFVDRPAPHKCHRQPTPYLGGIAIVAPVTAALFAGVALSREVRIQALAIALGGAAVAAIGLVDDWRTINPRPRLIVQALAAAGLWAAGIRVAPTPFPVANLAITILAVMAVTNAVNLLDNMDGVSTGTVAVMALFVFLGAHWEGQHVISAFALVLAGACLGFLIYNFHPARIFLGDTGTLFMGFLTSALLIKLHLYGYPVVTRLAVPVLITAVPLFDMALVVISRQRAGRRVFRGGTDHSSHRLVAMGASIRGAALIEYAAAGCSGGLALLLFRAHSAMLSWVVCAGAATAGVILLVALEGVDFAGASLSTDPAGTVMWEARPVSPEPIVGVPLAFGTVPEAGTEF